MKIKQRNKIKERIASKVQRIFAWLENENNCDFATNGEGNFIDMWSKIKTEKTVVFDIGANKGDYTDAVLKKSDSLVYAFEPSQIFSSLEKRFGDNVRAFHFGFSDREETLDLYFPDGQVGSELSSLYSRSILGKKSIEQVSLKRLDSFIEENQIAHIHLMKIDVEGHELKVLQGMGKYLDPSFVDYIQFEYGGCNIDSGTSLFQLYTILTKAGFTITKIMPSYLEERGYSKALENYIYKNFVAVSTKKIKRS